MTTLVTVVTLKVFCTAPPNTGSGPHQNPGAVHRCAPSSIAPRKNWSAGGCWGTWTDRRWVGRAAPFVPIQLGAPGEGLPAGLSLHPAFSLSGAGLASVAHPGSGVTYFFCVSASITMEMYPSIREKAKNGMELDSGLAEAASLGALGKHRRSEALQGTLPTPSPHHRPPDPREEAGTGGSGQVARSKALTT